MISRTIENQKIQNLNYDHFGRLENLKNQTETIANYIYNQDRPRWKKLSQGRQRIEKKTNKNGKEETRRYPNELIELKNDNTFEEYVFAGTERIATLDTYKIKDEIIEEKTQTHLNITDHLSSSSITLKDGNIESTNLYSPFGKILNIDSQEKILKNPQISNFEVLKINIDKDIEDQKITILKNKSLLSVGIDEDSVKRSKLTFKSTGLEKKKISKAKLKISWKESNQKDIKEHESYIQIFDGSCKENTKTEESFNCTNSRDIISDKGFLKKWRLQEDHNTENIELELNPKILETQIKNYKQIDLILRLSNDIDLPRVINFNFF